jgi:hypothetical protein
MFYFKLFQVQQWTLLISVLHHAWRSLIAYLFIYLLTEAMYQAHDRYSGLYFAFRYY